MKRLGALPFCSSVPGHPVRRGHLLKGLAVVDDGNHVLDVAVRALPVPQVLFLVRLSFLLVSENTQPSANYQEGGARGCAKHRGEITPDKQTRHR